MKTPFRQSSQITGQTLVSSIAHLFASLAMLDLRVLLRFVLVVSTFFVTAPTYAGPVILGGDDLTQHGSVLNGANRDGWLYIQKAVDNILNTPGNITRVGNDGSIVALGSSKPAAIPLTDNSSGDAGIGIGSAARVLGKSVFYYNGATEVNAFFTALENGTVNPAMIWIAGNDGFNDLDTQEGSALLANAIKINDFVASGGGLMSHALEYRWLTALLPGITINISCFIPAMLTTAGIAAFPGVTNANISAGPCHNTFAGDLGGLEVLARDTLGRQMIIGGGTGTRITPPPSLTNVRLIETLSNLNIELDTTSFSTPPFSITPNGDTTLIEWRFDKFPANLDKSLAFEALLKNPKAGENRLVSRSLELLYTDINGNPVRTELGPQYVAVLASAYQISTATDKPIYNANESVQIATTIKNIGGIVGVVFARLSIQDTKGTTVASLGSHPAQTLAAGENKILNGINYLTNSTYTGNYKVFAELLDVNGAVIVVASAPFSIGTSSETIGASITADKIAYAPFDLVRIRDRVSNKTSNQMLDGLTAITTIYKPDGSVLFTQTAPTGQLTPASFKDINYDAQLSASPIGKYRATLSIRNSSASEVAFSETSFNVLSTADTGIGLTATLLAVPKPVPQSDPIILSTNIVNSGNTDVSNLQSTLVIVDTVTGLIVKEWPYSISVALGGSITNAFSWTTDGAVPGRTYLAILSLISAGEKKVLAQESFVVTEPPVKLNVVQDIARQNRVLTLLSCKPLGVEDPTCVAKRKTVVSTYLTSLGLTHLVTTDEASFREAFRSGVYNVYWISGGAEKLMGTLAEEVREAVYRGDSLLLDGVHDQRNGLLDKVVGVTYRGKLAQTNPTITLAGGLFAANQLPAQGTPLKLELAGGTVEATLDSNPVIVSKSYGLGRGLLMGFDLVASIENQPIAWREIMGSTFTYLLPPLPTTNLTGDYLPINTTITNLAKAVDLEVAIHLPAGTTIVNITPAAVLDINGQPVWRFLLDKDQTKSLSLALRLPATSGSNNIDTIVSSIRNNLTKIYGNYPLTVVTETGADIANRVTLNLQSISFATVQEQQARDRAVLSINSSRILFVGAKFEDSIRALLSAIGDLEKITSISLTEQKIEIDRLIQESELKWYVSLHP
jgi:hypothetical protein